MKKEELQRLYMWIKAAPLREEQTAAEVWGGGQKPHKDNTADVKTTTLTERFIQKGFWLPVVLSTLSGPRNELMEALAFCLTRDTMLIQFVTGAIKWNYSGKLFFKKGRR